MSPQRADIIRLAKQKTPPREICAQLGVGINRVYNTLSEERRKGEDIPSFRNGGAANYQSRLHIDRAVLEALKEPAAIRFQTARELAVDLLSIIASDTELVTAILDDQGDTP